MAITKATMESPPYARVVLLLKIAIGLALLAGMWVAQSLRQTNPPAGLIQDGTE
jgi:hypothetical protein